jgi:hypothetical protein
MVHFQRDFKFFFQKFCFSKTKLNGLMPFFPTLVSATKGLCYKEFTAVTYGRNKSSCSGHCKHDSMGCECNHAVLS